MVSADIQYITGVEEQMKRVMTWREGGRKGGREREREREREKGLVKGHRDCRCMYSYLNMHEEDSSKQKKAKMDYIWNQPLSPGKQKIV